MVDRCLEGEVHLVARESGCDSPTHTNAAKLSGTYRDHIEECR